MFPPHVFTPNAFAARFSELLPEYLPGMDTGAFEPTDRRRCWNKTLKSVLSVIGKGDHGLDIDEQNPTIAVLKDQLSVLWQRNGVPVFAAVTGWGDRNELEKSLSWLEAFKCPQKLFIYTCSKWQEAVLDQIRGALLHYPYHMEGEQYLFMNLLGSENRFQLYMTDIQGNGTPSSGNDKILVPIANSPFSWRKR